MSPGIPRHEVSGTQLSATTPRRPRGEEEAGRRRSAPRGGGRGPRGRRGPTAPAVSAAASSPARVVVGGAGRQNGRFPRHAVAALPHAPPPPPAWVAGVAGAGPPPHRPRRGSCPKRARIASAEGGGGGNVGARRPRECARALGWLPGDALPRRPAPSGSRPNHDHTPTPGRAQWVDAALGRPARGAGSDSLSSLPFSCGCWSPAASVVGGLNTSAELERVERVSLARRRLRHSCDVAVAAARRGAIAAQPHATHCPCGAATDAAGGGGTASPPRGAPRRQPRWQPPAAPATAAAARVAAGVARAGGPAMRAPDGNGEGGARRRRTRASVVGQRKKKKKPGVRPSGG